MNVETAYTHRVVTFSPPVWYFTLQVVRSLSACQGALLLVDATQGVQAQTLSTAKAAQAAGLKLVPVVTKIDLHHANVEVSYIQQ